MSDDQVLSAAAFNQLFTEIDGIYHNYAKRFHLSQTALFLLCTLYESDTPLTQRQLANEWHYPPQTVNSFLKRLETEGAVRLEDAPHDRRSKYIILTERGRAFCERIVQPLIDAEERAFGALSHDEQALLLTLPRKYFTLLAQEIDT